ncbi:MAG: hypothetical protein AAF986_11440 [Pseudomonadota bacterium]
MADASIQDNTDSPHDVDNHQKTYQTMMDVGFNIGLPVGCAIATFVALLLMGTGILPTIFAAFCTWLGLLIISKAFFSH